jgi:hypothetical protein
MPHPLNHNLVALPKVWNLTIKWKSKLSSDNTIVSNKILKLPINDIIKCIIPSINQLLVTGIVLTKIKIAKGISTHKSWDPYILKQIYNS